MDGPIVLTQGEGAEAISEAPQLLACFSFFFCINLACAIHIHAAPDGVQILPPHPSLTCWWAPDGPVFLCASVYPGVLGHFP